MVTITNKTYAYYYVAGSFSPPQITERVETIPTRTSVEGDPIKRTKLVRKASRWELHSRLNKTATLEEHVADVLNQLDARKTAFEQLSEEFGGVMELVGYFNAYYPGLTFEPETIKRLAGYSLSLDCDFCFLADEEKSEPT